MNRKMFVKIHVIVIRVVRMEMECLLLFPSSSIEEFQCISDSSFPETCV